jgi:hypothetical protein
MKVRIEYEPAMEVEMTETTTTEVPSESNNIPIGKVVGKAAETIIRDYVSKGIMSTKEIVSGGKIFEEVKKVYLTEAERRGIPDIPNAADFQTTSAINIGINRYLWIGFG